MKLLGKELTRTEQSEIFAGGPSMRRCQRLLNRSDRHLRRGDEEGSRRLIAKFEKICQEYIAN
ncbi:hypothetical protein F7018_08475 [Tenacibaculum aiptasiae]|uniref:Uncharacterized protein n=1 Tax=Tenacibaculum aiptasiae TaxID=426481 RepID=A0A7J5AM29_9FLAO|nr:hypothetical protein [Tenacibaculum aiptasiae]KAB1158644.1 hypothetical protein F7018_08475 [Tenacibaculum aiptasiae]